MARYSEMGFLETWYEHIDERTILATLPRGLRRRAQKAMDKARARGHVRSLERMTEKVDGERRIVESVRRHADR